MTKPETCIPGQLLIVDDDADVLTAARLLLKRHFDRVVTLNRADEIAAFVERERPVAILLDMNFVRGSGDGREGLASLRAIRSVDSEVAVVLATAYGEVSLAVQAMKDGATDFVLKPWENDKLVATLTSASRLCLAQREAAQLRARNRELEASVRSDNEMIGDSPGLREVRRRIDKAAPTSANVLILGENGTGKELVARALHRQSNRATQPFICVDLGSLSESLFESELFGHAKGSFTGALTARVGRFQAASGGTIFLDEIGNLSLHLQAKLLTVLAQQVVTPVGSDQSYAIDVRILAATNLSRQELLDPERFRQDLLYRINTVEISLPPLRERKEDILEIALHYLRQFASRYEKSGLRFSREALTKLQSYSWPGNIRALRHAIERAVIMADDVSIHPDDIDVGEASTSNIDDLAETNAGGTVHLETLEREAILRAQVQHHGNISHMAAALGLTRAALYRRMEKYGL